MDWNNATPAEMLAESRRRLERRANGLPVAEDADRQGEAKRGGAGRRSTVYLTIPMELLVSDNRKSVPIVRRRRDGRVYPAEVLTSRYRAARDGIKKIARAAMDGEPPLQGPVKVDAILYEPNRSRDRDILNLGKLLGDSMSKIVYEDDVQIDDAHWIRGYTSAERPRLEVRVSLLTESELPSSLARTHPASNP